MSAYTLKITTKGQSSAVKLPLGKTQTILADENTQYQILDADGKLLSQPRVEENSGDLWVFLDEDNVPELILQNYGEQYPIRDVQQLSDSYSTFLTGNSQAAASLPSATAKTVSAGLIGAGIAAVSTSLAVLAADGNKGDASDDDVDTAADTSITQPKVSLNPIQNINQQIAKNNKIILSGTVQDVDSDAAIESVEVHIGSQTYQAQIDKQNWTLTLDAQDLVQQQGENRLTVRAQVADLSGNRAVSEEAEGVYQVDTVAPAATLTLDPVNPSKINASSQSVILTGSVGNLAKGEAVEGATVQIQIGQTTHQAALQANGQFSLTLPAAAFSPSDSVSAHIVVKDAAGNSQNVSAQQAYLYDVTAPKVTVTINEINGGQTINAAVKNKGLTVSGSLQYDNDVDVGSVRVNINTGKGSHAAIVKGKKWTLTLQPTDLPADGSHNLTAEVTANDRAGNSGSHSSSRAYQLDTQVEQPQITFEAITADNIISKTEAAAEKLTVTGKVTHAREGDEVVLTVGTQEYKGTVQQGGFAVAVATAALVGGRSIRATVKTADEAGNRSEGTAEHQYDVRLDTQTATLRLDSVTADNILNAEESAAATVRISGSSTHLPDGSTVHIRIGQHSFEAQVKANSFSADIPTKVLKAHQQIQLSAQAQDSLGNTLSASHEHAYQVDTVAPAPTITLYPLMEHNRINLSHQDKNVMIKGLVSNLAEGDRAENGKVNIHIGTQSFQVNLQKDGHFVLIQPAATFAGSDKVSADVRVLDMAGNSKSVSDGLNYIYDMTPPQVTVTVDNINSGKIINAAVKNQGLTVSGSLEYDNDVDVGSVRVNINTGKGSHAATVNGKKWTLTLQPTDLPADGSYNLTAEVTANDRAGNSGSHSSSRAYQLDTQINAQLAIDQVTGDDVVNSADKNQAAVRISGRASGEFSENDSVEVQIGTYRKNVHLDGQGQFSLTVSGSVLAAANKVSAVLQASDAAGNTVSVSAERPYEVKLSGEVRIVLNKVTTDNVLQIAEQKEQIELSGKLEGKDAAAGQTVILTVNNQSFEAVVGNDKQFKVSVPAEALVKDADHKIQAALKAVNDSAGNPLTASASRSYEVEQLPATNAVIKITAVDNDFVIGYNQVHPYSAADTVLSGRINIDPDSLWGKWNKANARFLKEISFNIGGNEYVAAISKADQSFKLSLSQDQWQKLEGQALSYRVKYDFPWLENKLSKLTYNDKYYISEFQDPIEIDPKQVSLSGDMLKYGNGQYVVQKVAAATEEITVLGSVSGLDVKEGDTVIVYIGGKAYQTQVTAEKTFSVQVSAAELANSKTHEVRAELNVRNAQNETVTVSDSAAYTVAPEMSDTFVSEHGKVDVSTMPYFMQVMPTDELPADYGHKNQGRKHTLGTGANLKVHFVTAPEFANDNKTDKVEYSEETKKAIRQIFRTISRTIDVSFEEVASKQDADINFYMEDFLLDSDPRVHNFAGFAYYMGDVSLNSNLYVKQADGWEKNDGFHVAMHEIFHSLGLKHPHDGGILLNKTEDLRALTRMSYNNSRTKDFVGVEDVRIFDMAYLHYRYGVAKHARTGNDTYSFKPFNTKTADGDVYIWDGGGMDTFDASAEQQSVYVNLTPGSWVYSGSRSEHFVLSNLVETSVDVRQHFGLDPSAPIYGRMISYSEYEPVFVKGQAFIGYGTQIENLIGSAHNDVLIGNNADNVIQGGAGADTLEGGLGNDWLDGGAGADVLRGGAGDDRYLIDSAQDRIEETDNNGSDTVYTTIDYTLGNFVENLHLLGDALKAEGNALDNTLVGNSRDNVLNGGQGSDTLTGGVGADHFVFSSLLEDQPDIITDFKAGEDKIVLHKSVFTALTKDNLTEKLSLEKDTGKLFYDAQGNGQKVHFATLSGNHGIDELDQNHFILA